MTGFGGQDRSSRRDREIAEMVLGGATFAELSERFGARTQGSVRRLVERALDHQLPPLDPTLVRRVDLARLDAVFRVWWDQAVAGDRFATVVVLSTVEARSRILTAEHLWTMPTDGNAVVPSVRTTTDDLIERAAHLIDRGGEPPGPAAS
jgi:hypothetical protein